MQLVVHSPFGSRLNRAWGLALRKRFCRRFNFELQAAATEDAIVLSLSTSHSFPLDEVARYLHSATALDVLVQALLDAPLFGVRWRWNATTALALPRFAGGSKVAPQLQRMKSEDLLAAVFPDQVACAENLAGEREVPEHPLVAQTMRDCLDEAMDATGWLALLRRIESGAVEVRRARPAGAVAARRRGAERAALRLPRRRAARGAPHAGGAEPPLRRSGERRRRSASSTPTRSPACARRPGRGARNADEMHEALVALGVVADAEARGNAGWAAWLGELARGGSRDAARLSRRDRRRARPVGRRRAAGAGARRSIPVRRCSPPIDAPAECAEGFATRDEALRELLRARLGGLGPVDGRRRSPRRSACARADVELAPARAAGRRLRAAGPLHAALPPAPTPNGASGTCSRASIATRSKRLRREIEPVEPRDFVRFLFDWQRVGAASRVSGPDALAGVLGAARRLRGAGGGVGGRDPAGARAGLRQPVARRPVHRRPHAVDAAAPGRRATAAPAATSLRSTPILLLPRRAAGALDAAGAARAATTPTSSARARAWSPRILADARRLVLRRDRRRRPPAAGRARGRARRAGRARPRQLRQLRRPARAARAGGEARVGARAPAPRRRAVRHRGCGPLVAGPRARAGVPADGARAAPTPRRSSTSRASCCAATASSAGACSSARRRGCRRGATWCASTAGSRRAARSAAAASSPA